MPSGLDAALKNLGGLNVPQQPVVNYNGFAQEAKKKPEVTAVTIDCAAEGLEKLRLRQQEHEVKIKKLQDKIAGLPPNKKNKPEIQKLKDQVEVLQADGNYRAAVSFIRKHEDDERDRRRAEREAEEEAMMSGGMLKGKKGAKDEPQVVMPKKPAAAPKPAAVDLGPFECDVEVAGVIQSAVEGSEDAQSRLRAGPGSQTYASVVRAEVPSIASAAVEKIPPKLKRAATRDAALKTIRALLWNPPAVLPAFSHVLMMLDEAKLKSEPGGKATDLCLEMSKAGPTGKAVPALVIPALLAHMGSAAGGKWQVKVGTMNVLREVLLRLSEPGSCPKQLGLVMPRVMAALRDAAGEARKEVKREAEQFLRYMGSDVARTPELRKLSQEIVGSIVDASNMEKATDVLHKLANTTFMNTMDSCSFGLLFPVISRAMRERSHEAMMKGVQIVGASVNLIEDPEFLQPYVEELLPLLKECLMHPTEAIQREASKCFGSLAVGLPALCDEELYPWLLDKLQSKDAIEDVAEVNRRGAAHGLAEVLLARGDLFHKCFYGVAMPRIMNGGHEACAGGLALVSFLAHLGTQAFLSHAPRCLPAVLQCLNSGAEVVTKQAVLTVTMMIDEYGAAYPKLLLPRIQQALFFETEEARELVMPLFFAFCEKLAEAVKFGQDFLSMEQLSPEDRHSLLCSVLIAKTDSSFAVRRLATLLWKDRLQSQQKAKAEIMPRLLRTLLGLKESPSQARAGAAEACLAELVASGDIPNVESALDELDVIIIPDCVDDQGGMPQAPEEITAPPPARGQLLSDRAAMELASVDLPPPLRPYFEAVVASCCVETRSRAAAEEAMEAELLPLVEASVKAKGTSPLTAFGLRPALDKIFAGVADEAERQGVAAAGGADSDVLVRVDNLMLMYGGGHLLLKHTTLELKRGHRYGVIGRNGAGKTTLMSTIASGGVQQIPSWLKTLHVRPEVLVEASELTAVQFCQRDSPETATEETLQAALQEVGFPTEMQTKSVNELSGGWRMKLLLASAMLRDCDVLLLDEPTNHLDKGSVEWLSQYLCSQTRAALMVISHDPDFLNVVCTDIIQYSNQRTLEYYAGNFADFRRAQNISNDDEAEALLLGYEIEDKDVPGAFDPPPRGGAGDDAGDAAATGGELDDELRVTAGVLDKQSKITFPIPGKLQGHSSSKPVMECKNVSFAYDEAAPDILTDISCKLTLNSRVGIIGKNGAGKSTLLNLLCGELIPTNKGEVIRNRNLRLAYIAQQHMYHLKEFLDCSPYTYMQQRYKNGWDEALQERLIQPQSEQEANLRTELAKRWGKYGNEVNNILGRIQRGNELLYEVQWQTLDDPKQNTYEPFWKLQKLGVSSFARAYDERFAAQTAGIDQRPLTQKEIVKHLEQFGLDEELVMNRQIGGFSAGQKSKLTLGAAFWTRPHVVALDEPTNYIDMETLDALAKGLTRFKGGVVVISHSSDFVDRVCNEIWHVDSATVTRTVKKDSKK